MHPALSSQEDNMQHATQHQFSRKLYARQRVVYYPPSGKPYAAKVIQVDRRDCTVRIALEYAPGKWMNAWVSFGDIEGVAR
jgi:hypothetical protein